MTKRSKPRAPDEREPSENAGAAEAGGADPERVEAAADAGSPTLEEALRQRDEYLAQWQRAKADYSNLKRRFEADFDAAQRRSLQPLLEALLLVLDHLDLALATPIESADAKNLAYGVQLTRDQLVRILDDEGVRPIEIDESTTFDAELHQAMESVPDASVEPGTILATLKRGWTWRGRVLRYAQVRVAGSPDDAQAHAADEPKDTPGA